MRLRSGQGGSATVLMLAVVFLSLAAGGVATAVAAAVEARHHAAVAADAAALAAAVRADSGQSLACASAARVAQANGADLRSCIVAGAVATVSVEVAAPAVLGWLGADRFSVVRLNARAGPADTNREKHPPVLRPS